MTNNKRLSPKMIVQIYDDPITEQTPYTKVRLTKFVGSHSINETEWMEQWWAIVEGEERTVTIKCK